MRDKLYIALENFFGLEINTILSGIGITAMMLIVFILKHLWVKFRTNDTSYVQPSLFDVKEDIIDSKIEDIDIKNSSTQVFNVGGSIKNSEIKNVKVRDHE